MSGSPLVFSAFLLLQTCTVQAGSHSPHVAVEPLKCGQSELRCTIVCNTGFQRPRMEKKRKIAH